jgi:XTP/dITP diphosphohydrolase
MILVVATRNQKKLGELQELLADMPVTIRLISDFPDAPDVEETGQTFVENAELKARSAAESTGHIALADDSGLEIDALGGKPGVMSNRFAGPDASDQDKYMLILNLMDCIPDEHRSARFRAAVAIATPEGEVVTVEGKCEGMIAHTPSGEGGFGYDPIFYIPELGKTMAQLDSDEKNRISHRGKALRAAKKLLRELLAKR